MAGIMFPFVFGVNADFAFQGTGPPSLEQQIENLEVSEARLTNELAAALSQIEDLGKQRDKAVTAERIAREVFKHRNAAWKLLHEQASMDDGQTKEQRALQEQTHETNQLKAHNARLEHERKGDFDKIADLEYDIKQLSKKLDDKDNELRAAGEKVYAAERDLVQSRSDFETADRQHQEQVGQLQENNERLKEDVTQHQAVRTDNETSLSTAWVETNTLRAAHAALVKAKDEVEAERLHFELLNNDLQAQWEQDAATIEELKQRLEEIHTINASNENFQTDIERLTDMLAETRRTIMVKDERIANLEDQVQKERHRYLSAEEAADIAMPMSPQDEAPPMRFNSGDSLAAELDATDDYDMFEDEHYQHIEQSHIIEVVNWAPVAAVRQDLTVDVNEVAAYSPVEAARARLSVEVSEVGHVTPIAAVRPDSSISINETASFSPIEAARPELTFSVNEVGHVTPITAVHPSLSVRVNETASVQPIEVVQPKLTLVCNEVGHTSPIATSHPSLSVRVSETASVQPIEVVQPRLTLAYNEAGHTSPIAIIRPSLSIGMNETASVQPIAVVQPKLILAYNEVGHTSPIERKINTTSTPAQTDVQTLASEISYASMLETFPISPVDISTGTTSTQTEAEVANINAIDLYAASLGISPIEAAREPVAEIAFGPIRVAHDVEPVESPVPEVPELKTNSVTVTHSISPRDVAAPEVSRLDTAPIQVAHDIEPLDTPIPEILPAPKMGTTPIHVAHNISPLDIAVPEVSKLATVPVQVAHDIEPLDTPIPEVLPAPKMATAPIHVAHSVSPREVVAPEVLPAPKMGTAPIHIAHNIPPRDTPIPSMLSSPKLDSASPLLQASKFSKSRFPSILAFLTAFLAFVCFKLYAENQALRSRVTYARASAFGNGRHFLGVFPIAMDVGGTWFSEQVARYLSMGIMRFEDWAGITYVPMY
jgi:hypothetical protein